jgi:putative ABC transport system permease protein
MRLWLFRLPLRHLTEFPGRTLLCVFGIALGTAVYLGISLAGASALESFRRSVNAVSGRAEWRLRAPGTPLPEELFLTVRSLPEVRAAAPVAESVLELEDPGSGPVLLLGVDPFAEAAFREYDLENGGGAAAFQEFLTRPDSCLVSEPLARRLGLRTGSRLRVVAGARAAELAVVGSFRAPDGLYPLEGAVLLMDISGAQELLDRVGRLDYIDVIGRLPGEETAAALKRVLPPGVEVSWPGAQTRQMEGLVASYRLNLQVLSAIALFVGMFLIYQSVTLSVVRRRREIGLLRTLGLGPRQVLALFVAEGVFTGLVGGLVGLFLGLLLARGALGLVTDTLTSLYTPVAARRLSVTPGLLLQAWALAVLATLAAALVPAIEAARTRVRAVWFREELEEVLSRRVGRLAAGGLGALVTAGGLAALEARAVPIPGFVAAFLILLSCALLTPAVAWFLGRGVGPGLRRLLGVAGELGCRYLAGSLSRSAVSIAALACALGMLIAVAVMIGSFRETVNLWISRSISGDIFFGPAVFSTAAYDRYLPPEIVTELRQDPEIRDIYLYRCVRLPFRDRFVLVIGGSFDILAKYGGMWFRQGDSVPILAEMAAGAQAAGPGDTAPGAVIISEPLAQTFGWREGQVVELPTPSGPRQVRIQGVFYDFRTDGPSLWMDLHQFRRYFRDEHLNAVRLYLRDPGRVREVQESLRARYGGRYRLLALSHQDLRRGILEIFDRTFAVTYALEGVAVLVAVFGIITTFLVLIIDRERDLALLQAIGASRRQILGMVLVESGLASFLSFLLGAGAGSVLSLLLILVINKQAFGWTIRLFFTPGIYVQSLVLVLALGLVAGAVPAWRAVKPHLAGILKEE